MSVLNQQRYDPEFRPGGSYSFLEISVPPFAPLRFA
jgi:hypothetical protein